MSGLDFPSLKLRQRNDLRETMKRHWMIFLHSRRKRWRLLSSFRKGRCSLRHCRTCSTKHSNGCNNLRFSRITWAVSSLETASVFVVACTFWHLDQLLGSGLGFTPLRTILVWLRKQSVEFLRVRCTCYHSHSTQDWRLKKSVKSSRTLLLLFYYICIITIIYYFFS